LSDSSDTSVSILNAENKRSAFLFEFDHFVLSLREMTLEVLPGIFEDQEVLPLHLSKAGLRGSPHEIADALKGELTGRRGGSKKLGDELLNGLRMQVESGIESGRVQVSDALRNVIVQAREANMAVVGLSSLPESLRDVLTDKLDLNGLEIHLEGFGDGFEAFPKADVWLRLLKEGGFLPPTCISLTSSMFSTKAALTAGTACVAVPDRFTDFQDYGGAQGVYDSLEDIDLKPFIGASLNLA